MKVGFVVPGFSEDEADWCIPVLVDVFRELGRHAEVHVFTLRYPYRSGDYRVHGVHVHAIGGGTSGGIRRASLLLTAVKRITGEHRRGDFDVLHGLWADEPGVVATATGVLLRIPSVVSVMGGELVALPDIEYGGRLSRPNRLMRAFAFQIASGITAGCSAGADAARHASGRRRANRISLLPWGIDESVFPPDADSVNLAGSFRVLQVGSLVPVKDTSTLLRALSSLQIRVPGVHLHLVGDGPLQSDLVRQAADLGVGDAVTFHGQVRRELLGRYYYGADVLVVSSRHEMQPVVALEAALCGLPIVGTRVGMIPELVPECLRVAEVGDDVALASAIDVVRVCNDRRALAEPARERVLMNYLSTNTSAHLLDLYGRLRLGASGPELIRMGAGQ